MEFTKEAWENAPEGARLEWRRIGFDTWEEAYVVGFQRNGQLVAETPGGYVFYPKDRDLRIVLPKRKVMVQLWRTRDGEEVSRVGIGFYANWTLLGEHTFEIEGE